MTTTDDLEARLESMFAAQAESLDVPAPEWDSRLTTIQAPRRERRRPAMAMAALVTGAAVLGVMAASVVATREERLDVGATGSASSVAARPAPFTVRTGQVSLVASGVSIEVGGKTFSVPSPVEVHGDPGTPNEYTTLELTWHEHGVRMMWNIYFKSDGREWWSNEIRTYDGAEQGEWITYEGDFFRRPLGAPYVGDFEVAGTDHGVRGHLRLPGLRLEAFSPPAVCDPAATAPYTLDASGRTIHVEIGLQSTYSTSVTLLEAATCHAVLNPQDFDYRWTAENPAVIGVSGEGDRASLRGISPGSTTVRITAVRRGSDEVVAEAQMHLIVRPSVEPSRAAVPDAGGPPPPP